MGRGKPRNHFSSLDKTLCRAGWIAWLVRRLDALPVHHRQLRISSDSRLQIRVTKNTANIAAGGWWLAAAARSQAMQTPRKNVGWLHRGTARPRRGRCSWAAAGGAALCSTKTGPGHHHHHQLGLPSRLLHLTRLTVTTNCSACA